MKKKKNRPTLTLTLPLVELAKGQDFYNATSYDESGLFFVKSSTGEFGVVEVVKETNEAYGNMMPLNVMHHLSEQIIENKLNERLRYLEDELVSFHKEMNELNGKLTREELPSLEDDLSNITDSLVDMHSKVNGLREWAVKLDELIAGMSEKKTDAEPASFKGCISEDALVQLIKEIKK